MTALYLYFYLAILLIALILEPLWTLTYLGVGLALGGPPVVALGWWMHRWSERAWRKS